MDQLQSLLHKEVSRKEFLAAMGAGLVGILGFSSVVKMFEGKARAATAAAGSTDAGGVSGVAMSGSSLAAGTITTAGSSGLGGYKPRRRLIKNGHVLTLDKRLGELPGGDVLIDGAKIVAVASNITTHAEEIIDARDFVVMPGLIDNHRHMWESLIRGIAANQTFGQYFSSVLFGISPKFTPNDVYLGNLLSAYEALDGGVTTILDWAHANNTHEHALAAIEALQEANIRAFFAYGPPASNPAPTAPPTAADIRNAYHRLKHDQLVTLAMATSNPETSDFARVQRDIALARELGIRITLHAGLTATGKPAAPRLLDAAGLMGNDLTFIHGNMFTRDDLGLIAKHGAHMTCAPEVEMQMGLGASPLGAMLAHNIRPTVSVDIVAAVGGDMFTQLRFMLQTQRMLDHATAAQNGTQLPILPVSTKDVLAYVTTNAAASLGLENQIGSLAPGKQADIILVDKTDLNFFLSEPSAALVQSAHPGNVDTVLVAGRIVKRHKRLVDVNLDALRTKASIASKRLLA